MSGFLQTQRGYIQGAIRAASALLTGIGGRFTRDQSGAMALTVGLMFTSFAGIVGLSLDLADWYSARRAMQSAVDAAALGGALQLYQGASSAQAKTAATTDGNLNATGAASGANLSVTVDTTANTVTATMTKTADLFLSALFLQSAPTISVTAVGGTANGGTPACLLVTSPNASKAIDLEGSSSIQASGCQIRVNSNSTSAVTINGNTRMTGKSICGPGTFSKSGSSAYSPAPTTCGAMADNMANLTPPANVNAACDYTNFTTSGSNYYSYTDSSGNSHVNNTGATKAADAPFSYSSGVLSMPSGVYCGGINLGAYTNVSLGSGTYIVRNGGFNTSGNTTANGTGVSLYLTGTGALNLTASTTLNITAPTTGTMAGVAVYQDHSQTDGSVTNNLNGNSSITFTGLLYFGNQNVNVAGSSDNVSAGWTAMVAYTLTYTGYSTLYLNANYANSSVPFPTALDTPVVALLQ
jgi:Flp pilus assembly protein TadG